jgi:hypothetical protein
VNQNVNGPGDNPRNVVPFFAAASTKMAQQVERHLKQMVLMGLTVQCIINFGPDVGMTQGRKNARAACTSPAQRDIVDAEQYLPSYLTLSINHVDPNTGAYTVIVPTHTINNYVPETVPRLR